MKPRQCELEIRRAAELDVPAIQQVAREAWDATYAGFLGDVARREIRGHMYSERALREDLGRCGSHFFVAGIEQTVVAFGEFVPAGGSGEVVRIAVRPAWQRHGIATALLHRGLDALAAEGAGEVTAGIEREDEPARSFFEAHGFQRIDDHGRDTPREMRTPDVDLLEYARAISSGSAPSAGPTATGRIEVWCDDGRVCPRCLRRYARGVSRCADCGVSLVAEAPARPRGDGHRFVPLLRTNDESRLTFVSSALESSDIAFSVHPGHSGHSGHSGEGEIGPVATFEVSVPPGRIDEAREVIERLDEAPVAVEDE